MANAERIAKAFTATMELYGRRVSVDMLDLFTGIMARFEADDVLRALETHMLDPDVGQYPPKPADVVRRIQGGNGSRAAKAWAKVMHAIRTVGGWPSVVFDDPLIHACISDMGGWIKLCEMKEADAPFRAKDFDRLYMGYRQQEHVPAYPPHFPGRAEIENRQNGFPPDPPLLLGDQTAARLTHDGGSERPRLLANILPQLMAR